MLDLTMCGNCVQKVEKGCLRTDQTSALKALAKARGNLLLLLDEGVLTA